jgi:hypothetical protein
MKLTKENIKYIDDYLIENKVKYIDVRLELIDHLASEFEEKSDCVLLEDFLMTKRYFIKSFVIERQKIIHWSYQKQLWKRFSLFFYKPKYLLVTLIISALIYFSFTTLSEKTVKHLFMFSLFIPNVMVIFFQIKGNKLFKKVQSASTVFAIMSLPALFLYSASIILDFLIVNSYFFFSYWLVALLFSVAGLIEIYIKKTEIIKKYSSLIKD